MTKPSKVILLFVCFAAGCKSPVGVSKPSRPELFEQPAAEAQVITLKTFLDNDASAYNVYYQKNNTSVWETKKIQKNEKTSNAYTLLIIENLEANTEYTFYITALNSAGESGASNSVTARTKLQTPVISNITAINHYTMELTWNAVPGADSYSIFRSENPNEFTPLLIRWDLPGNSTACEVTVDPDKDYRFWVQAFAGSDAGGNSSNRSMSGVITSKLKSLESFTVDRSQINHNSVVLRWGAVQGAASYEIRYLPATAGGAVPADPAAWSNRQETPNTEYRVEELTPNTAYYFAVKALNANLNESLFIKTEAVTLLAPPSPEVVPLSTTEIALSWQQVSGAAMYQVSYNTENSFDTARRQELSGTACTVRGLTAGTEYYFWVSAYSDRNSSRPSPALKRWTLLNSPESLTAVRSQADHNSIVLRWDAVQGAVSYEIRYLPATAGSEVPAAWSNRQETPNTEYRVEELTPNTAYYFAVKALNANLNESLFSRIEAVTLLTPPNPAVARQLSTAIALSWPQVSGAAMYQVSYNTENLFDTARRQEVSGTTCTVQDLTAGTEYYFWVSAYSDRNSSQPSPALKSRTITSNIVIEFDFTNPADPVLLGMPDTIRQGTRESYTVSVTTGDWDAGYAWYLNGALKSTDPSYRVGWQLTAGTYVLTVIVTKDGVPYSASARFQVINN